MVTVESRSAYLENGKEVFGNWERFELDAETLTPVVDGAGGWLPVKHLETGFEVAWADDFNRHQIFPEVRIVANPDFVPFEYPKYEPPQPVSFDEFNVRRHGAE